MLLSCIVCSKSVHTGTNYKENERYQSNGNAKIFQVKVK